MSKRLVCPNDKNHDEFLATAIVSETWLIDRNLNWKEVVEDETSIYRCPQFDSGDLFICDECGTIAVEEDEENYV